MKILFQGDSITDMGRNREDIHNLGNGYPKYVAEYLQNMYPNIEFEFVDLGIGGNRTCDLVARLQSDFIDIQPDIVSILVGINDTWRRFDSNDPTSPEQFEANYRKILTEIKEKTHAKIIILEPYLLDVPEREGIYFREDLSEKIFITRRLAREFADVYIPLDGLFAAASIYEDPHYWTADGIHPTDAGAEYIADYYVDAITSLFDEE